MELVGQYDSANQNHTAQQVPCIGSQRKDPKAHHQSDDSHREEEWPCEDAMYSVTTSAVPEAHDCEPRETCRETDRMSPPATVTGQDQ